MNEMIRYKLFGSRGRNLAVTIWLWFCLVVNVSVLLFFTAYVPMEGEAVWLKPLTLIASIAVILGYVLLLLWQRAGFYLLCLCSLINALIMAQTSGVISMIPPVFSMLLLYGILQIRKNNQSYWDAMQNKD